MSTKFQKPVFLFWIQRCISRTTKITPKYIENALIFLHIDSEHSKSLKDSILYNQALRIKRICAISKHFEHDCKHFEHHCKHFEHDCKHFEHHCKHFEHHCKHFEHHCKHFEHLSTANTLSITANTLNITANILSMTANTLSITEKSASNDFLKGITQSYWISTLKLSRNSRAFL